MADYTKLIKRLLLLLAVVFVLDRLSGMILENLFFKQQHGDEQVSIYAIEKAKEDILIFGSSRASHHYVAGDIEQRMGMTCYNVGRDEMTITYTAGILPIIYKRYTPKVIILEMLPTELENGPDKQIVFQRVATTLLPFLHRHPELAGTIKLAGMTEYLKARVSAIYPYNSLAGSIVQNTFTHLGHSSIKGYEPLDGAIDTGSYKESIWKNFNKNYPVDTQLTQIFQQIITITGLHHTRLVTVVSPFYFANDFSHSRSYNHIRQMLQEAGCEFYDFSNDTAFVKKPYLFKDDVHLNDSGAHIYTRKISGILAQQPAVN